MSIASIIVSHKPFKEMRKNKMAFGQEITSYITCLNCTNSNYTVNMLPKQVTCKQGNKVSHSRYVPAMRTKCFAAKTDLHIVDHSDIRLLQRFH